MADELVAVDRQPLATGGLGAVPDEQRHVSPLFDEACAVGAAVLVFAQLLVKQQVVADEVVGAVGVLLKVHAEPTGWSRSLLQTS